MYIEMMPYASTMLFGYFEIVLDDKIKFPNKFYVNNFTRKMATLAKSGHFTSKILLVKFIHKHYLGGPNHQ